MFDLTGKVAVVTGGGSGIGEAIARAMVQHGALVYIADINATSGQGVADDLKDKARFVQLDISDAQAIEKMSREILGEHDGAIDVLVNNAAIGCVGNILAATDDDLDRLINVNVKGTMHLMQAFLPGMIQRRWGSMVNVASIGGVTGVRDRFAYCTTKFAVVGMTKCVAIDHADSRVRCNAICPGRVETPWVQQRIQAYPDPKKAYDEMAATQALKRMGKPEEIAAAAVYLAADESAFVTGSTLIIDGGWTAGK